MNQRNGIDMTTNKRQSNNRPSTASNTLTERDLLGLANIFREMLKLYEKPLNKRKLRSSIGLKKGYNK